MPTVVLEAGPCSNQSVSLLLSARDAEQMAYLLLSESDAIHTPDVDAIFTVGTTVPAQTESLKVTIDNLIPASRYTVFAAARTEDRYSEPESVVLSTTEQPPMLTFVSSSKNGFDYRIQEIAENQVFFHTYLEKWAYDELRSQYEAAYGEDFDLDLMLRNTLADYGLEATGPQTITWTAGDENPPREGPATIVGGKPYYAVASLVDPVSGEWIGKPETIAFSTEAAGKSDATIDISIEELTTEQLLSRIAPDQTILFYFYHLFPKADVDDFIAEQGQEAFENYIYENGYVSDGEYTDRWAFSVPGDTYLLAVLGIDRNGDTMYADLLIEAPQYQPDITVSVQPHENELQGYFTYNSLEVTVTPLHFGDTPLDNMMWVFSPAEVVDALLEAGMTIEEGITNGYLIPYPIAAEWYEALQDQGSFTTVFDSLEEQTKYYFIVMAEDPAGELMVRYSSATTEAAPAVTDADPEYLACLGTWTVSGKTTEDWYAPMEYTLTVEQLTVNRSFLVRGWSKSSTGTDYPFVMNYDPDTKTFFIRGPQSLGTFNDNGTDYEVLFTGLFTYGASDDLKALFGPSYIAFTGSIDGDQLRLFSELFKYEDQDYEFKSLGYSGRDTEGGFHRFTGDEYDVIYFQIHRTPAAPAAAVRPASVGSRRSALLRRLQPAVEISVPFGPLPAASAAENPAGTSLLQKMRSARSANGSETPLRPVPHSTIR